jgi:hypothetical protein
MEGLICTAHLETPIVIPRENEVHLDALLSWSWMAEHCPEKFGLISGRTTRAEVVEMEIPVLTIRAGSWGVSLCSSWDFPSTATLGSFHWVRRKDGVDMGNRARRLSPSSPERPQFKHAHKVSSPYVSWTCWGDREKIAAMLARVECVGGLRSHGCGVVREWVVDRMSIDPVGIWVSDGVAKRNLPIEVCKGPQPSAIERLACQSPYWLPCMQGPTVRAGSAVVLKPWFRRKIREAVRE